MGQLVRKDEGTNPDFGISPVDRPLSELMKRGFLNIDKPAGPTSHQVSAYVQKILNISKAGHSGTLDPNVTGVLPIGLEKGTKVIQTLLKAGKEYVCLMHLHKPVEEAELMNALAKFTGKIMQLPPIKSSVKRQLRERTIYYIDVLDRQDQDVLFRVGTQAGTYIRKLVHDIGQELGTGAHMAELRRTRAGPFTEETLCTLQDVADAYHYYREGKEAFLRKIIIPVEAAVSHLPKIWVLDTTVDSLCHGASLGVPGISKVDDGIEVEDLVGVFTLKDELICYGISKMTSCDMLGSHGLAVVTEKVVMDPGTYPKY